MITILFSLLIDKVAYWVLVYILTLKKKDAADIQIKTSLLFFKYELTAKKMNKKKRSKRRK